MDCLLPAEGVMERIEEQAEGVGDDGREAHHDANEGSGEDGPARVGEGHFVVRGWRLAQTCSLGTCDGVRVVG